jgi:hypothetical protein
MNKYTYTYIYETSQLHFVYYAVNSKGLCNAQTWDKNMLSIF